MAPDSRKQGARMALLTDERYALCPLWRQLVLFWSHELVALDRNTTQVLKIFPSLEVLWLKADAAVPFETLLSQVDGLALRDPRCHLIVCVDDARPAEMQELLDHGVDEIVFQAAVMAEPRTLQKTVIALKHRREQSEALKTHIVRHQKALQSKTEFLAWLSHEIRTPMNGVLGLVELFPQQNLSIEQLDMLQVMERSGHRVVDLLSEVLDVSRIEAGKMSCVSRDFQLRNVIDDSLHLYARDAKVRGLRLSSVIDPDVPDSLCGDERKLHQILNNLISNAVKYTSAGHVLVKVRVEGWEGKHCRLLIEVQDSGHGIAAEELDRIFKPFEQTQSAYLSKSPSSGLGLSLTKNLVELLGGNIRVQSHPGIGSTFSCSLPFALQQLTDGLSEQAGSSDVAVESAEPILQNPGARRAYVLRKPQRELPDVARVLVVDDDPVNLKVADKQLKKLKANTTLVTSGVDALDLLEKTHFDLIFVDCQMPHMDGFELLKIMRGMPHVVPGTPVIALTALGREEDRERALQHGFTDFLAKPAQLEDIQKLLERWLPREDSAA